MLEILSNVHLLCWFSDGSGKQQATLSGRRCLQVPRAARHHYNMVDAPAAADCGGVVVATSKQLLPAENTALLDPLPQRWVLFMLTI